MSAVFTQAIAHWRQLRAEFELYREHAYARAEDACAGVLLNSAAQREGISAWSLFIGPEARAYRWASDELREHWREHPRMTFEAFERARVEDYWPGDDL